MINLSFPQVIVVPPLLIILGAVTLLNFKNLFLAITNSLVYVKNFLEAVVGKASSFSFKLEHILLVAIIFALFAVANEIS
ncbi:hypothetical protein DYB26_014194, partial [Aphanomyces astaci]